MIKREFQTIITPEDIGIAFAESDSKTQAEVLYHIANELQYIHSKEYNPNAVDFCFQADAISKEHTLWRYPRKRDYLIDILEDLLEHIKAQKKNWSVSDENK